MRSVEAQRSLASKPQWRKWQSHRSLICFLLLPAYPRAVSTVVSPFSGTHWRAPAQSGVGVEEAGEQREVGAGRFAAVWGRRGRSPGVFLLMQSGDRAPRSPSPPPQGLRLPRVVARILPGGGDRAVLARHVGPHGQQHHEGNGLGFLLRVTKLRVRIRTRVDFSEKDAKKKKKKNWQKRGRKKDSRCG